MFRFGFTLPRQFLHVSLIYGFSPIYFIFCVWQKLNPSTLRIARQHAHQQAKAASGGWRVVPQEWADVGAAQLGFGHGARTHAQGAWPQEEGVKQHYSRSCQRNVVVRRSQQHYNRPKYRHSSPGVFFFERYFSLFVVSKYILWKMYMYAEPQHEHVLPSRSRFKINKIIHFVSVTWHNKIIWMLSCTWQQ